MGASKNFEEPPLLIGIRAAYFGGMTQTASNPPIEGDDGERFVSIAFLCRRYDKSRMTIHRWVKAGYLPAPDGIGPRPGFRLSKILKREKECARLSEQAA